MPPGDRARRRQRGFTYVGLLALIVVMGLLMAAAGEVAAAAARREREAELLWVGHEYRAAIGRYWRLRRTYPKALEELLGGPPDAVLQVRCLRQLYRDPMTGAADWVLLPAPGGGIMGVASGSARAPLKIGGFEEEDREFADAVTYGDWKFAFLPGGPRRRSP